MIDLQTKLPETDKCYALIGFSENYDTVLLMRENDPQKEVVEYDLSDLTKCFNPEEPDPFDLNKVNPPIYRIFIYSDIKRITFIKESK